MDKLRAVYQQLLGQVRKSLLIAWFKAETVDFGYHLPFR